MLFQTATIDIKRCIILLKKMLKVLDKLLKRYIIIGAGTHPSDVFNSVKTPNLIVKSCFFDFCMSK